jgi:hypothetical protein
MPTTNAIGLVIGQTSSMKPFSKNVGLTLSFGLST